MNTLRKRRHDTLLNPPATRDEMAVDHAVAPFDRVALEMDTTWGVDRLPELVSPETAARYGRTLDSLNAAIAAADVDRVVDRAAACIRGMRAMDAEARAAGHEPPRSGVIVYDSDGFRFGVLPDPVLWRQAQEENPGIPIYTMREIGILIKAAENAHPGLADVRASFPGAEIKAIRSRTHNDEIPF